MSSSCKTHVFRLLPHQDLKKSVLDLARANGITAGIIASCVGSLEQYNIRFANQKTGTTLKGFFEIVSLTGTFSETAAHIHISVSDDAGRTTGGHLLDDNLIYTTAEVAVAELTDMVFDRVHDDSSGFKELVVKRK
jgi:predicted DNA-binding protein with PD1-like motif